MCTVKQIQLMLDMQNQINTQIDPNWIKTRNPFMLAAALEYGEAIEHYGWKWWKAQKQDMDQVRMELVDIWHFMLSQITIDLHYEPEFNSDYTLEKVIDVKKGFSEFTENYGIDDIAKLSDLQLMTILMGEAAMNVVNVPAFLHLCYRCGLPIEALFKLYVGKNILNSFRQANGYKEGTYIKVWSTGKEDNEHLTEIMNHIDINSPTVQEDVFQALTAAYVNYA